MTAPTVVTRIAPPRFSEAAAAAVVRDGWGVSGRLTALPSERDQNFQVTRESGQQFVLKISEAAEAISVVDCQNAMLARLVAALPGVDFPAIVPNRHGRAIGDAVGPDGAHHLVRLLRYVPGVPLATVRHHPPALLREVGTLMGSMALALEGFADPAAHRDLRWDLRVARRVIAGCTASVVQPDRRGWIAHLMAVVDREGAPLLARLRTSVIHNDGNDYNVLVSAADPADPLQPRHVTGLVDFGDVVHSYTVADAAVSAAYAMLHERDALAAACHVVQGYTSRYPLTDLELAALFPLICLRLCLSAVLAAHQRAQEPDNAYLSISETPVWAVLEQLVSIHPRLAHYRFRDACGLVPCPASVPVVAALAAGADRRGRVLDPDPRRASRVTLDLTVGSTDWDALHGRDDVAAWADAIAGRMDSAGAAVGIGRYDEPRRWYTADQFRVATDDGDEWRTVHIGVDLFAPAGTPVLAPLDAVVASVRRNAGSLNYGPTVILRHDGPEGGVEFFTLYGHLDPEVLARLRPGQRLRTGDRIGCLGSPSDNGGWAPHLHLQIIVDPLDDEGDFPGVARPSEREVWLSLSPDPNLILGLPEGCRAPRPPSRDALLAGRRERIGPSLSIAYRAPLTIVRGRGQHLYDDLGRAYLDVVNNVAHVGHCHPRVVDALRRQSAVLNTNTRYLHPDLARYAERLTAHLPEPLRVCYFVCSGSEANELALRLARAHTGRTDVVVVDHAYHGNTTSLVDLSPYKFNGPGGRGAPESVHTVVMPDAYRGPHRGVGVGQRYATYVRDAIADVTSAGRSVAAFFAEAIVSGGGHVEPPPGYFSDVYRDVRAAGAVCVADEVQVGFGRVGTDFWAFEAHGVIPDIVTMGKPIGNGHPMGAVVTTDAIAASFANGMEYFNTFGGNPVSCAVGLAVLDVLEGEGLQERARQVGGHLSAGLRGLMDRHPLIGDVRGRGLFQAVELVRDRATLDPAPRHTAYVVERMRERGILLSTEGPFHTVIKMKPPLIFSVRDADFLLENLDSVLGELATLG